MQKFRNNVIWTTVLTALAGVCLGLLSLYFAAAGSGAMCRFYLKDPLLPALNVLPFALFALLLFGLTGRAWLAFLLDGVVCLVYSWAAYWKWLGRSEPLYADDVAAIRDMRALVSAGGSILLYPEGEVNGTGRTGAFPESTARLCKLLKAPVYAVRTKGSYLTRPKWGPSRRRGRVETDVTLVATAEELPTLSNEALYTRIQAGMFQDEYAWQAQTRVPFHAKNPAEGLHLMLYRCPKCGREFAMRTEGNAIFCTACGNRGLMDCLLYTSEPKRSSSPFFLL